MEKHTEKRIAKVKLMLTKRTVENPGAGRQTLDRLGRQAHRLRRPHPAPGRQFLIVTHRAGGGGCKASNKRVVIERYGCIAAIQVRR